MRSALSQTDTRSCTEVTAAAKLEQYNLSVSVA
jgi:hypothetical protein